MRLQIRDITHRRGSLYATCATDFTKKWLEQLASKLQVGNTPLKTVDESALIRYMRARGYIRGTREDLVPDSILRRVRRQNDESLMVAHWTIADIRRDSQGAWVLFRIPEPAIPNLQRGNNEIYHLVQVVTLKVFSPAAVTPQGPTNRSETVTGSSREGGEPGQPSIQSERPNETSAVQAVSQRPPVAAAPRPARPAHLPPRHGYQPARPSHRRRRHGRSVLAERERRRREEEERTSHSRHDDRQRERTRHVDDHPRQGRSILLVTERAPAPPSRGGAIPKDSRGRTSGRTGPLPGGGRESK